MFWGVEVSPVFFFGPKKKAFFSARKKQSWPFGGGWPTFFRLENKLGVLHLDIHFFFYRPVSYTSIFTFFLQARVPGYHKYRRRPLPLSPRPPPPPPSAPTPPAPAHREGGRWRRGGPGWPGRPHRGPPWPPAGNHGLNGGLVGVMGASGPNRPIGPTRPIFWCVNQSKIYVMYLCIWLYVYIFIHKYINMFGRSTFYIFRILGIYVLLTLKE